MRKPVYIATTVLFLTIMAFPQIALADDQPDDDYGWEHFFDPAHGSEVNKPLRPETNPDHRHRKLEDQYGEVDHVAVPRIAIRPGVRPDPGTFVMPIIPESDLLTSGMSTLGAIEDNSLSGAQEEVQEFVASQLGVALVSSTELQILLASNLNPSNTVPIQIRDLVLTKKTPADEFLDGAMIFGAGLGLLAVTLLGITGVSALKLRREAKEL